MIIKFYTSLLQQVNTLGYPCVFGISRSLNGNYINIYHYDVFNISHFFEGLDDCYYFNIQANIKCHSDMSMEKAIKMRNEVHNLLKLNIFVIDGFRIAKVKFENAIDIGDGVNEGFTSSIIYNWILGTQA